MSGSNVPSPAAHLSITDKFPGLSIWIFVGCKMVELSWLTTYTAPRSLEDFLLPDYAEREKGRGHLHIYSVRSTVMAVECLIYRSGKNTAAQLPECADWRVTSSH